MTNKLNYSSTISELSKKLSTSIQTKKTENHSNNLIFHYLKVDYNLEINNMPASKIENFSVENIESAQIGRAFAHPTRVHIFNILNENSYTRNKDLTKILKLTKSTIHGHLKKLEEAGMIQISYHQKSYLISKNSNANKILAKFNQKLTKEVNFKESNHEKKR